VPPLDAEGRPIKQAPSGRRWKFDSLSVPRKMTVAPGEDNKIKIAVTKQEAVKYGVLDD
jgi:hypothetical protein